MSQSIQYDQFGIRYNRVSSNQVADLDWLFLPGGPGANSRYLKTLLHHLTLPGKVWLIDLPGNGDNIKKPNCFDYDFDRWDEYFIKMFSQFEHPILVGHSFGGTYPLLFPELENILSGFVTLGSAPCLWRDEAEKLAKENNIITSTDDIRRFFEENQNKDTYNKALQAFLPRHFLPHTLEAGRALFEDLPFNYHAAAWWFKKSNAIDFSAKWIPMDVPTLIIGGTHDCVIPISLFERDKRFHRENITIRKINKAGHSPWFEDPKSVIQAFEDFQSQLTVRNLV